MVPAALAVSAIPKAPGSVLVHYACACGVRFDGYVHASVRGQFWSAFQKVHSKYGCVVIEEPHVGQEA